MDDIADKGEVDFVKEVASLVPMNNICDMIGILNSTGTPSPTNPSSPTAGGTLACCRAPIRWLG